MVEWDGDATPVPAVEDMPGAPSRRGVRIPTPTRNPTEEQAMAKESVHKKLERVRPPRVNITYEVETGGAMEVRELPFVMGVLADFSGNPSEELPKLKDRKFTEVTLDNFDDVLASMKPRLRVAVDNKLSDDPNAGKIGVELKFASMDDFSPDRVARQVEPLQKLLDLRNQLADLRGKIQSNEKLEELLQSTLSDDEKRKKLKAELDAAAKPEGGKE
jgi:type VI secretion system protein ImpB